jgi:hypothetical protein
VAAALTQPLSAQISQDRPALCGISNATVPVPKGITATLDPSRATSVIALSTKEGEKTIALPGSVIQIQQVCPLHNNQVILFGTASSWLYNIAIIDTSKGELLDSFYGSSPSMSPNQNWLMLRKFYPAGVETTVSEEYLLYDLGNERVRRGPAGMSSTDMVSVGRPVYPAGQTNATADNLAVSENQAHEFKSTSFFWSGDSKEVVFADSVQRKTFVVLIRIAQTGGTEAYNSPVDTSHFCDSSPDMSDWQLSGATFENSASQKVQLHLDFASSRSACEGTALDLSFNDFIPATPEIRSMPHRKPSIMKEQ